MISLLFFTSVFFGLDSLNDDYLQLLYGNEIRYYDEDLQLIELKRITNNEDRLENYKHLFIKNELFLLGKQSGEVYKIIKDSLIRIDETIDHRMTVNAYVFSHNDTIFKYGGYGYWSQRNFITYFDRSSKEWEVYKQNSTYFPEGSFDGLSFKQQKKVYFFNGEKVDIKNRTNTIRSNDVILFDFETNDFSLLGRSTIDFKNLFLIFRSKRFLLLRGEGRLIKINPAKNLVETFDLPPVLFKSHFLYSNQSRQIDDHYYFVTESNPNEIKPIKISEKDIFSKSTSSQKFYRNKVPVLSILFIGLCLTIIILLVYLVILKKRRRTLLTANGIYHKSVFHKLENKQVIILSLLKEKGHLSTTEILSVIENKSLTYVHNIRLKNEFIDKLNNSIRLIFELNEFPFYQIKGDKDKRIKYLTVGVGFSEVLKNIDIKIV